MKLLRVLVPCVIAGAFLCVPLGCSQGEGGEAAQANQEVLKQNPTDAPPVPPERASGDATMMGGGKKSGG